MIIDCDECAMQHTTACDDCVVALVLGSSASVEFADVEVEALDRLAAAGLVSPIRLVSRSPDSDAVAG